MVEGAGGKGEVPNWRMWQNGNKCHVDHRYFFLLINNMLLGCHARLQENGVPGSNGRRERGWLWLGWQGKMAR